MDLFKTSDLNKKNFFLIAFLLFFEIAQFFNQAQAEVFPKNIADAFYYYNLLSSNFNSKMKRLHDSFPNRQLTTYWQYAASSICDAPFSHAYIPRVELIKKKKIQITIDFAECGQSIQNYRLEFTLLKEMKAHDPLLASLLKDLLNFKFPELNFSKYSEAKIFLKEALFEWIKKEDQIVFSAKLSEQTTILHTLIYQFPSSRDGFEIQNLKMSFLAYESNKLVFTKTLFLSYKPFNNNQFPGIEYFDENGNKISAAKFLPDYSSNFSNFLNQFIISVTNIDDKLFTVKK